MSSTTDSDKMDASTPVSMSCFLISLCTNSAPNACACHAHNTCTPLYTGIAIDSLYPISITNAVSMANVDRETKCVGTYEIEPTYKNKYHLRKKKYFLI